MNARKIIANAVNDLDRGGITFGEYLEIVKPWEDAVPVRHGRWIYHPEIGWGETWLCSKCGERTTSTVMGIPRYKWCPMCGADMRGNTDEND